MTLIHGDCLVELPKIPSKSVNLILTDMPYGTTKCKWDTIIPLDRLWIQLKRISSGAIVLSATQPFTSRLIASNFLMFKYNWTWDKVKPIGHLVAKYRPMQQTEDICVFGEGKIPYYPIMIDRDNIIRSTEYKRTEIMGGNKTGSSKLLTQKYPTTLIRISNAAQKHKIHPTQKPIELMSYLIKTYTQEKDVVLDFAMGSGTTGAACRGLNRDFIGIEKYLETYEKAYNRLQAPMDSEILAMWYSLIR